MKLNHEMKSSWITQKALNPMKNVLRYTENRWRRRQSEEAQIGVKWPRAKEVSNYQRLEDTDHPPPNSRSEALPTSWFPTVASSTEREQVSLTLSHQVCDQLLEQTQKTNRWLSTLSTTECLIPSSYHCNN